MTENWDKDIVPKLLLKDGERYKVLLLDLAWLDDDFNGKSLRVITDQGIFWTRAWNFIRFLQSNKPVIDKILEFEIEGEGQQRRFKNLRIQQEF